MSHQPETRAFNVDGKYRPMFRLQPDARWQFVRRLYDTASQALAAADMIVEAITKPAQVHEEEPQPLGSIEEWRQAKDAEIAAERETVFAALPQTTIFPGKGRRPVMVERKRRRAA